MFMHLSSVIVLKMMFCSDMLTQMISKSGSSSESDTIIIKPTKLKFPKNNPKIWKNQINSEEIQSGAY